ncbi:MAG TPA: glycosyltransferase family 4 protein [Candidatus Limnocylindrales bacterium]|nr:glycosyltransferase family 4 protein [Candidatus Limnocylindrales bacterium]
MTSRSHRLIHVVGTSAGGHWFLLQASQLVGRGHQLLAVLPDEGPLADSLRGVGVEVRVVRFLGSSWRSLPRVARAQLELIWIMARHRPTVAHYHLFKAIIMGRIAAWIARVPVRISQWPGSAQFDVPILARLDRATVWMDDLVVGSCRDIAIRAGRAGASRTAVVYYGLDTSAWDVSAPELAQAHALVLEELGIPDPSTRLVGMVGYMYPTKSRAFREIGVKGHEVLIDAAALLVARLDDVHFVLVGDEFVGDGSYRAELEGRVKRLGLEGHVSFLGHRHDIARLTRAFDILVVPSMSESASYAAMQALLLERPVVGSRVGGIPDTVQHGETGMLVEPGSPQALAEGIAELLKSPSIREAMGRLGRRRVLERFDITKTVDDLEALYDRLVEQHAGAAR